MNKDYKRIAEKLAWILANCWLCPTDPKFICKFNTVIRYCDMPNGGCIGCWIRCAEELVEREDKEKK